MSEVKTLKEQIDHIANVPVTTAISNVHMELQAISKRLRGYSLQVHGTILNMLQAEFQLRQEETKNAIEEHKFQESVRQRDAAMEAQKALEAEQAEIAAANQPKPSLVRPQ